MAFIEVDEENFEQVLTKEFDKKQIVILKFGSEFCDSCHALEWELEEVDDAFEDVSVLKIDTDESPELAEQYEVYRLPTMVIYKNRSHILYNKEGVILSGDIHKMIGK